MLLILSHTPSGNWLVEHGGISPGSVPQCWLTTEIHSWTSNCGTVTLTKICYMYAKDRSNCRKNTHYSRYLRPSSCVCVRASRSELLKFSTSCTTSGAACDAMTSTLHVLTQQKVSLNTKQGGWCSLLKKNFGRREPGNIHEKSFPLPFLYLRWELRLRLGGGRRNSTLKYHTVKKKRKIVLTQLGYLPLLHY